MPVQELVVEPEIAALGLVPAPEEQILASLWADFTGNQTLRAYFGAGEMVTVESETVADKEGIKAPSFRLAILGSDEAPTTGGDAFLTTTWVVYLTLPPRPDNNDVGALSRWRLNNLVKSLVYGSQGAARFTEDGENLTQGVVIWSAVNAGVMLPGNAALRTAISFKLISRIRTATREVG